MRVVGFCIFAAVLLCVVLGWMMLTGYVPAHFDGPEHERVWVLLFGTAEGFLMAGWFAYFFGVRHD